MKLHQLSLFVENKPGRLSGPCRALAEAKVNILALSLADTDQFGVLRVLVHDWQRAKKVLEAAGSVVNVTEVVAIEGHDRPGGAAELLAQIEACQLNIEYMYSYTHRREDRPMLIFRFADADDAIKRLEARGVNVVKSHELAD